MSDKDCKKYEDCRRFRQVSLYDGTVEVTNTTNPAGGSVQVPPGHKTTVVCDFAPFPPSELAEAATAAAVGGSSAGLFLGSAIVVGGTVGGLASGRVFSGSGNNHKTPKSPNQ